MGFLFFTWTSVAFWIFRGFGLFFLLSCFVIHWSGRSVTAKNCVPLPSTIWFSGLFKFVCFFLIGRVTEMTKILSHQLRMLWSQLCGWQQCHPVSPQAGGPTENSFIKPFPAVPVSSSSPTSTSRLLSWCFLAIIYFLSLLFNFLPGDEFMAAWQSAAVRAAQITVWIRHLFWSSSGL